MGGFDEGPQKSRSMQQNSQANVQRSDEQMCLLYGATARVVNRRSGSQSTNSFSPALFLSAAPHPVCAGSPFGASMSCSRIRPARYFAGSRIEITNEGA